MDEQDFKPDQEDHGKLDLPPEIRRVLKSEGGEEKEVKIALPTDMSAEGVFGEQWLLIDSAKLRVITSDNGSSHQRTSIELDKIEDAQIEQCVGNGLLNVSVEGRTQVLLHFSNELTERFDRVATTRSPISSTTASAAPPADGACLIRL
jgi:hypothetical protein